MSAPRLALPRAVLALAMASLVLVGCMPPARGESIGLDTWVSHEGDHFEVVEACAKEIRGAAPLPDDSLWGRVQLDVTNLETSVDDGRLRLEAQGTIDFLYGGGDVLAFDWRCSASEYVTIVRVSDVEVAPKTN